MASIDSSLVTSDIKKLISISQGVKKAVKKFFETLETAPSSFSPLKAVSPAIRDSYNSLTLRKAKITPGSHDYRIIFAR